MDSGGRTTRSAKRRKIDRNDIRSQDLLHNAQNESGEASKRSTPRRNLRSRVKTQRSSNGFEHINRQSPLSPGIRLYDGSEWIKDAAPAAFVDSAYQSVSTFDETGHGIHNGLGRQEEEDEDEEGLVHNEVSEDNKDNGTEEFIVVQETPTKTRKLKNNILGRYGREGGTNEGNDLGNENRSIPSSLEDDHQSSGTGDLQSAQSSGRRRKKSNKLPLALAETTKSRASPTNTSTRKRGRPKRIPESYPGRMNEEGVQLHFDDLPTKSKLGGKKRGRPQESLDARHPVKDRTPQSSVTPRDIVEGDISADSSHEQLKSLFQENGSEAQLELLKSQLMGTLTGKQRMPLIGLEDEYEMVFQLVEQTVGAGEGNSMLLLGARGSAKTTLVEAVISEAKIDHMDDFHVVRLSGFIHTDDKLALKEIWRQLGREMEVDNATASAPTNYADTLASLLALLSHPADLTTTELSEDHTAKSVVFIIDEFDLFVNHSRQTLLYNLFDIAQSRKAPIAVLGLTTKINVVESLEKRVKSRFSHRYVHLSLPRSFPNFREICKAALTYQPHISSLKPTSSSTYGLQKKLQATWNDYVSTLLETDPNLDYLLRQIYAHSKSVSSFFATCLMPILSLTPTSIPTGADFISNALAPPDSKLNILPGLSDLELALLISAARLDVILDTDTCNFNMAYDEYVSLAEKAKLISSASGAAALGGGVRVWGRDIAMGAWERLEALELLVSALGAGGGANVTDVGRAGKLWKVDVGLEEIGMSGLEMSSVVAKWCREI